jgi:hypothetical protein
LFVASAKWVSGSNFAASAALIAGILESFEWVTGFFVALEKEVHIVKYV